MSASGRPSWRCATPTPSITRRPGRDHEEYRHGAAPNRFMTHLAMLEVDDEGNSSTWGEHVTDEEYNATPTS